MIKKNYNKFLKNFDEITLVGTFSRVNMFSPWFIALYEMKLPRDKIHLILYNNTDDIALHHSLIQEIPYLKTLFRSVTYFRSNRTGGGTLIGQENDNFNKSKLKPIWEMWNDIKNMIKTPVFMLIEDDTIAPSYAFEKLFYDLFTLKKAGFVTGIETGRSMFSWSPTRLGVHKLVRKGNKIIERISLNPDLKGIHEVDCSGVYCFVTYTDIYKKAFKGMDKYVQGVPFFGMDNILTNNIKKLGYKLYADFSVWCDHLQQSGGKLIPFNKKQAVPMADLWIPKFNNYGQGIIIKKKTKK